MCGQNDPATAKKSSCRLDADEEPNRWERTHRVRAPCPRCTLAAMSGPDNIGVSERLHLNQLCGKPWISMHRPTFVNEFLLTPSRKSNLIFSSSKRPGRIECGSDLGWSSVSCDHSSDDPLSSLRPSTFQFSKGYGPSVPACPVLMPCKSHRGLATVTNADGLQNPREW